MSRKCDLTGKGSNMACNVSHSHVRTKKRQYPNVQYKRIWVPELNRFVRLRLSTRAIRSVTKLGLVGYCQKHNLDFGALING
ncbi:MAG: 50S ribosomal protein L28 [Myxococcales bacterium]|nr:50S ribosomal protein L28 [Myxococcales bacterium]